MYYFYMGSVLLPISPEKFTLKVKNSNKTITLINEAEVNVLRDAGLTDLEFDALIPAVRYSFANYDGDFKSPAFFTNHFEKLKTEKKPFQFIIVRKMPNGKLLFDTNMTVSMESYTIKEDAKQGFDLVVSFKLKQYKPFGTKIVKVIEDTAVVETQRETDNSPMPKQDITYVTKKGDTLSNIAKYHYADWSKYRYIHGANQPILDRLNHHDLTDLKISLPPGEKLVIPAPDPIREVGFKEQQLM